MDSSKIIYSFSTFKTYYNEMKKYIKYVSEHHPEVKRLRFPKNMLINIQKLIEDDKSAYTITTAKSANSKTLKIDYSYFVNTPSRNRMNINNNRNPKITIFLKKDLIFILKLLLQLA